MMHPADAGGDALGLGRDALALARLALDVGDVTAVSEMRSPIEHAMAGLRVVVVAAAADRGALREVLDGLAEVLAELDARADGAAAKRHALDTRWTVQGANLE